MNPKYLHLLAWLLLLCFAFSCTPKGEEDPWLSLRSRNARLKGKWKMTKMENTLSVTTVQPGQAPVKTVSTNSFDGRNIRIRINDAAMPVDSSFGYSYDMNISDNGKLAFSYTTILAGLGVRSDGEDQWFWLSDDRKKSHVYLGAALQYAATAGLQIPGQQNLALTDFMSKFEVVGLRKDELKLAFNKQIRQSNLDGSFQEIVITHSSEFELK